VKVLKSENINNFFNGLKNYLHSDEDKLAFLKIDEILENYGIIADARTRMFYYTLLRAIRILNQRFNIEKDDYNIVKWFIEKTNCKVDIFDIIKFNVDGPENLEETRKKANEIDDISKQSDAVLDDNNPDFSSPY